MTPPREVDGIRAELAELEAKVGEPCLTCLAAHRQCADCRDDLQRIEALTAQVPAAHNGGKMTAPELIQAVMAQFDAAILWGDSWSRCDADRRRFALARDLTALRDSVPLLAAHAEAEAERERLREALSDALDFLREPCTPNDRLLARVSLIRALAAPRATTEEGK